LILSSNLIEVKLTSHYNLYRSHATITFIVAQWLLQKADDNGVVQHVVSEWGALLWQACALGVLQQGLLIQQGEQGLRATRWRECSLQHRGRLGLARF